jgi:metal-sulfur cluster biosynthetic enzyme
MTMASYTSDLRITEIWKRLSEVTDPELDEPVTELGFVERVAVLDGDVVEVDSRLPTYWCAANFAFLMVDDIRAAVAAAPWCRSVRPRRERGDATSDPRRRSLEPIRTRRTPRKHQPRRRRLIFPVA